VAHGHTSSSPLGRPEATIHPELVDLEAAGGDEAPVRVLLTDDVCWHVPGRNAIAADH
jgi:hypothetical protein